MMLDTPPAQATDTTTGSHAPRLPHLHGLRGDALAFGVILVFAIALCAPVLVGKVPIASDTLYLWAPWSHLPHEPVRNAVLADSTLQNLAWLVFARESVYAGEWPMWDPYAFSGFPFAGNSQSQIYYPLTWLLWLLPLGGAIQALAIFNICLAGWGMYVFCRSLGVSRAGSLIAGLAFAGSGMLQLTIDVHGVASVYGWLPWMLFATDRALRTRSSAWFAVAALLCGVQAVAGHMQWVLYSFFAVGCWVAWRSLASWRRDGLRSAFLSLLRGGLVLVGGVCLAVVHLTPFFELTSQATRTGVRVSSNSWPLTYLLRLVMPEYFGTAAPSVGVPMVMNDLWAVGILPLLLAAVALVLSPRHSVWFWAGLALLAVLVTYGIGPFLYARWLPGLNSLLPMRIGYLFIAGVAVLAGVGYDAWVRLDENHPRRAALLLGTLSVALATILVIATLAQASEADAALREVKANQLWRACALSSAALLALAFPLLMRSWVVLRQPFTLAVATASVVCIVVLADLLTLVPGYNSFVEPGAITPSAPSVEWIKQQPGFGRVLSLDTPGITFNPNTQTIYSLYAVGGYDSLHTRQFEEYWGVADPGVLQKGRSNPYANISVRPQAYTSTVAALLNVRYVASAGEVPASEFVRQLYTGEISIYENTRALPRAFLISGGRTLPPEQLRARLAEADFDPRTELLLAEAEMPPLPAQESSTQFREANIISYKRNYVTIEADVQQPAWLVLADPNYPGWRATVDGQEARIYTAYHLLRAVPLPPGKHTVVFSYLPTGLPIAAAISGGTLLLLVGVPLVSWVRKRPKNRKD